MYIENHLTGDDMQRAHDRCPNPPPATLLAGSYLSLLEAIDIFTRESVSPVTSALLAPTARETVILGLYYRSLGFCRTAIELNSVVHQQSLTSAERSVIELYVDMELLHRNVIADAIEKFNVFMDYQKLKAARRIDTFFAAKPALDTNPSKASVHREPRREQLCAHRRGRQAALGCEAGTLEWPQPDRPREKTRQARRVPRDQGL